MSDDQLSSTHPITVSINKTNEAESIFDGISYGKGASFLKQLHYILSHETMEKGLHVYFKEFAWKNTELKDFVKCLHDAYVQSGDKSMGPDFNVTEWSDSWLSTSGTNILEPFPEEDESGNLKSILIEQTIDLRGQNRIRTHKIDVAVYD